MTPTQRRCLEFIQARPGCYAPALADSCAPRPASPATGAPYAWTAQGAARMGGKLAKSVERPGWVRVDRYVDCGVARLYITPAGERALAEAPK